MLAAVFVIMGVRSLRNPDPLVPRAKPITDQVVPTIKKATPPALAQRVPDNPRTLVRLNAAVHVLGGIALATGRGRRAGALALAASLVPTTIAGHAFWEEDDPAQRANQQVHFLKNLGLAGGLLLAAVDTEGKPSLVWRARHGAREARRMTRAARREAQLAAKAAKVESRLAARAAKREFRLAAKAASKPARPGRPARAGKGRGPAKVSKEKVISAAKPVLEKAGLSH